MKQRSRTKSALLNISFNFLAQISNTVLNMVLPPLIIAKYGSSINGLIATIRQLLNYVRLVGAGIAESTVVSFYQPLNNQDNKKISAIFNACARAFAQAGTFFSLGVLVIAFVYPLLLRDEVSNWTVSALILVLSIIGLSEFFVIGKITSLLLADQRGYFTNIAQTLAALLSLFASVILIKEDFNIIYVQALASSAYLIRIIILVLVFKRLYPQIDTKVEADFSATKMRKAATVHQLASMVTFGSQAIIISIFCGLKEASVYAVYSLIFTGINMILATISGALVPSFGNLIMSSDKDYLTKVFKAYETNYYLLLFTFYTVAYNLTLPFVKIYTRTATDISYFREDLLFLFVIMGLLNCLRTPGGTLINAKGHYRETQNRSIYEMLICFTLELILVQFMGVQGVLIATIIAFAYRTLDVIFYSHRRILAELTKTVFLKISLNLIFMILLSLVLKQLSLEINSYRVFFGIAFILTATIGLLYLLVNSMFYKKDISFIMSRIRGIKR